MKKYQLKSIPGQEVKMTSWVFDATAGNYLLLTGQRTEGAEVIYKSQNVDAALVRLDVLNLGSELYGTQLFTKHLPASQDLMFLAIARAVATQRITQWNENCRMNRDVIAQTTSLLEKLKGPVREEYRARVAPISIEPLYSYDLGIDIKEKK